MGRKEKLLKGLDVRHAVGIEIGPLANPLVSKQDGTIYYVDYTDAEFLRHRYKDDPNVDISKIVSIDAIWGKQSLKEAMKGRSVDYIVASHVVEHVPDLVTWLGELHSVLNQGGQVRLVVPDRRYTFDYLRQVSRLSDILTAYLVHARVPQPHEIFDFCLNKVTIDARAAWRDEIDTSKLTKDFTYEGAMWLAQDVINNGTYHDVHCWVFTPSSFAQIFVELAKVDLLKFSCEYFITTAHDEIEFYVGLKAMSGKSAIVSSWENMMDCAQRGSSSLDAGRPEAEPDDRRSKLLNGIDVAKSTGIEIGALCRPFVRRNDGHIYYMDHADTATLREKYRIDPAVDVDALVDVDVVWGQKPLAEAITEQVDYVIGSHVVEHVPDLIGWLDELASVLHPTGEIRLIVPDRRFTFDYLRRETGLSDVVFAHMMEARVPLPSIVLDYVMNVVKLDAAAAWQGDVNPDALEHHHSLQHALNCAVQARDGVYHDVHCWVFTPRSFASLMIELARSGLSIFECTQFFDTAPMTIEFFVGMKTSTDREAAILSWQNMRRNCSEAAIHPARLSRR